MPGRDDNLAASSRRNTKTLLSICGRQPWVCRWVEPMVQLRNHRLCRDLSSRSSHSILERQYLRESNVNDLRTLVSKVGSN